MPSLKWIVIAHSFAIDRATNNLSIFNQIDEIQVPADAVEPEKGKHSALTPGLVAVMLWARSDSKKPEAVEGRIVVSSPTAKMIGQAAFKLDLLETLRNRTIVTFPFFAYSGPGEYSFTAQIKGGAGWRAAGSATIEVKKLDV
jgi:hypothetical protein